MKKFMNDQDLLKETTKILESAALTSSARAQLEVEKRNASRRLQMQETGGTWKRRQYNW